MKKKIILDCDPGIDDAVAIIMALASEKLDIMAITTVAGNQTQEKILKNAKNILQIRQARSMMNPYKNPEEVCVCRT